MNNFLNGHNKKYLPIPVMEGISKYERGISGFSYFTGTLFALYKSYKTLHFLNLFTGETRKIDEFREVSCMKCISHDTFVVADPNYIYIAAFDQDNIIINGIYPLGGYFGSRTIDSTKDSSVIVLSAYEKLIRIANGKMKSRKMSEQYCMAISPDGKMIASGDEKGIKILDAATLKTIYTIKTEKLSIVLSFSPDGKVVMYGDDYANIYSFDFDTQQIKEYENPYSSKPAYIGWLDGGKKFIVTFLTNALGLYNIDQTEPYEIIFLKEFESRYFQHAALINENMISVCIEDLRTNNKVESVPESELVCLVKIP